MGRQSRGVTRSSEGTNANSEGVEFPSLSMFKWVRGRPRPAPPRCRGGVNSPHLPACVFHAPGDPIEIALEEEPIRDH